MPEPRRLAIVGYGKMGRLVEQFAPPSMLLSPDDKLVHLSEHAGRYLVHPGGEPTTIVRGDGKGGRCSELAVRFALEIVRSGPATPSPPLSRENPAGEEQESLKVN